MGQTAESIRACGGVSLEHTRPACCVVLPAFNEGPQIGGVIAGVPAWVDGVLVVDDGSSDDTAAVVEAISDPRVRLIRHEQNAGVGAAVVTGYREALAAGYDIVVKVDADGQMDLRELSALVLPLQLGMAEYAKGNRFRRTGRPASMPRSRWFGSVMLSFLTKVASGYWHVFDPQCGFTAITAPALARLKLDGIARDYFFENDMLIRLNVIDARVVDVSTAALYGEEKSSLRIGRVAWSFPLRLVRGFVWRFIKRHVVNDFGLVALLSFLGGILLVFGLVFGVSEWVASSESGRAATAGTVMIAVLPIILGIEMLLQALTQEVHLSAGAAETREYARRAGAPGLREIRDGEGGSDRQE